MSFDRILILGARGQLGSALVAQEWPVGTFVLPATRDQLDITDAAAVWSYLMRWRPRVVINAAAYTQVDRAEDEPELAMAVNHRAVASIVQGVRAIGARLVHLSTDYVFDGAATGWYREADQVNPLSVYGRSKRAGELAALELDDSVVIRTSGLYSSSGSNFVKTIRRLGRERNRLEVVDDQRSCPTSADDLARAIAGAVNAGLKHTGLFHVAAPDCATWWEMADEILTLDGRRDAVELDRISTEQRLALGQSIARRPADSRLSSDAFATAYDQTLQPWRDALRAVCSQLDRQDRDPAPV
ncbi:MAG: dTDP-4-dehydrorhamnose reductase [Actinomycetota bacterium]